MTTVTEGTLPFQLGGEGYGPIHEGDPAGGDLGGEFPNPLVLNMQPEAIPFGGNEHATAKTSALANIANSTMAAANTGRYIGCHIPCQCHADGIKYRTGGSAAGGVRSAIYDVNGVRLAYRSSDITGLSTARMNEIDFDTGIDLDPGYYFYCLWCTNSAHEFLGSENYAPWMEQTDAGGPPATITPPTAPLSSTARGPNLSTFSW